MKSRSNEQKRLAVERSAKVAYEGLLTARELYAGGDAKAGFYLARSLWLVAVMDSATRFSPNTKSRTSRCGLMALFHGKRIDQETFEYCSAIDVKVTGGWAVATDTPKIVEAATALLEATESNSCRKRRLAAIEKANAKPGRIRQLATAACGLFAFGGAS